MSQRSRTSPCGVAEGRTRLRTAQAYLEVAGSVLDEPDGAELAKALLRLLDLKDAAHYGVMVVASRKARDALRSSARLVDSVYHRPAWSAEGLAGGLQASLVAVSLWRLL